MKPNEIALSSLESVNELDLPNQHCFENPTRDSDRLCNSFGWIIQTNNCQIVKLQEIQKLGLKNEVMKGDSNAVLRTDAWECDVGH